MGQLISVKIDVTKIDKSKIYKGQKGSYLELQVSVNDEVDTYGNDVSVSIAQTEDERKAGAKKTYLGNGKTFWVKGQGLKTAKDKEGAAPESNTKAPQELPDFDEDDLPF